MWIMTNTGFLSCVQNRNKPEQLLVRARAEGEIESIFPGADVFTDPNADYHFRAYICKEAVAKKIAEQILGIDYDNFKNSVRDHDLHHAYSGCWSVMHAYQRDMLDTEFSGPWGGMNIE